MQRRLAPAVIRDANRALVLWQLRRHQPLSRAEIARRSGLSEGTVSRVVSSLLAERLVTERGFENSTGGRPGTRLLLDSGHHRSIGVEIQNWETRIALGTIDGRLLDIHSFRTATNPDQALHAVAQACDRLLTGLARDRRAGVGIAVRGVVDNMAGVIEIGSSPGWNGLAVAEKLARRLRVPVHVENNVRAAAMAEYTLGGSDVHTSACLLFVRVDEGIGAGIIQDGKLYRGPHMAAGEFGEMVVAEPASLESLAANPAICERYAASNGCARKPRAGETGARVRAICNAAMRGDAAAKQAIADTGRYLGIGIANLVWCLDPDMLIVDGAIVDAWPLAQAAIEQQFPAGELANFRGLKMRPSALGVEAALIGAALLPFGPIFSSSERSAMSAAG